MKRYRSITRAVCAVAVWTIVGLGVSGYVEPAETAPRGPWATAVTTLGRELGDGRSVRSLLVDDRPNAVLVYSTQYAFSCAATLNRWRELDRSGRVNLVLLLTDEPTAVDRRAFALRRIEIAGVISGAADDGPYEFLVDGPTASVIVESGSETGVRSAVLKHVTEAG